MELWRRGAWDISISKKFFFGTCWPRVRGIFLIFFRIIFFYSIPRIVRITLGSLLFGSPPTSGRLPNGTTTTSGRLRLLNGSSPTSARLLNGQPPTLGCLLNGSSPTLGCLLNGQPLGALPSRYSSSHIGSLLPTAGCLLNGRPPTLLSLLGILNIPLDIKALIRNIPMMLAVFMTLKGTRES